MADSDLHIALTVDASGVSRGVAQAKTALSALAPSIESLGGTFGAMADRATQGVKGLANAVSGLARAGGASAQALAGVSGAGVAVAEAAGAVAEFAAAAARAMGDWAQTAASTRGAPTARRHEPAAPGGTGAKNAPSAATSSTDACPDPACAEKAEQSQQRLSSATAANVAAQTRLQREGDANRLQSTQSTLSAQLGLERSYAAQVTHVVGQGLRQQESARRSALDQFRQDWNRTIDPLVSSFTHGLVEMVEGTRTFGEVLKGLGHRILDDFISNVVDRKIEAWLWGEAAQTSATGAGVAARAGIEQTGFFAKIVQLLTASLGIHVATEAAKTAATVAGAAAKTTANVASAAAQKATAAAELPTLVGLAGAGGVASMAAAPFPLDLGAPAFGAAMAAAAAGFGAAVAAEGGFDIGDFAPLTLLHPREMVLPAHLAERVRSMTANDTRASAPTTFNYTAHAYGRDADDIERVLARHGQRLQRYVQNAARNNARLGVRRA